MDPQPTTANCPVQPVEFSKIGKRKIIAEFDGGRMSSYAGALALREVEERCQILDRIAAYFTDYRDPSRVEHSIKRLLGQRIYGLLLGCEDLNDHDRLRDDPILCLAVGCEDIEGVERVRDRDKGHPLASSKTLNRLELSVEETAEEDRYKRMAADPKMMHEELTELFLESYGEPPERIILDLDATDYELHGNQEGKFYHGYYRKYCYLPLYITCGEHIVVSLLRPSNIDASKGSKKVLKRVVKQIRRLWPEVEIWIRADSGFCRDKILSWCEKKNVTYIVGLGQNRRLQRAIEAEMEASRKQCESSGEAARHFRSFPYRTLKSWSRERRVVAKAEYLTGARGYNARFVVTNLDEKEYDEREVYEDIYCARGEMENRIKEQQLDLFADRISTCKMQSNQLRLLLSAFSQGYIARIKERGLKGTQLEGARSSTIRERLFKIAVVVTKSMRRFKLSLSSCYPWQRLFVQVVAQLRGDAPVAHALARSSPDDVFR